MSLEVVRERGQSNRRGRARSPTSQNILDSDGGLSEELDEEVVEEEVQEVPRVEFIPRERNPVVSGRPRDNRERVRGGTEKAQEEDLLVQRARGRMNLAMVDASFDEEETTTTKKKTKKTSSKTTTAAAAAAESSGSTAIGESSDSGIVGGAGGSSSRPTSASSATAPMISAALVPDQTGALGSTPGNDDLSRTDAKRLQNEFSMYLEQGKQFAKESLIARLESELEGVERELAYIDQFRSPDNKRKRQGGGTFGRSSTGGSGMNAVRNARPSSSRPSSAAWSRPTTASKSRPSTANRSRPTTATRSRPSTATGGSGSRPSTAGRSRGGGGGVVDVDDDDGILDDYASDDSDFAVPETSNRGAAQYQSGRPSTATERNKRGGNRGGNNSGRQRPSTAGSLRGNNNQRGGGIGSGSGGSSSSSGGGNNPRRRNDSGMRPHSSSSSRVKTTSTRRGGGRSQRPASSPLVRANGGNKFDNDPGFVKGEIAGYKPPVLNFDEDTMARSRTMGAGDIQAVFKLNEKRSRRPASGGGAPSAAGVALTPAQEACLRVGIQPKDLLPRPVSKFTRLTVGFQTLSVGKEEAYQRWSTFDEQRQKWLAAVLFERQAIIKERSSGGHDDDDDGGGGRGGGGKRPSSAPAGRSRGAGKKEVTLKDRVEKAVRGEKTRVDQVTRNRERTLRVRMKENTQLQKERDEWAALQQRKTVRGIAVIKKKREEERKRAKKAKERADEIQKIRKEKHRLDEERLLQGNARQANLERRLADMEKQKKRESKRKMLLSSKREKHRATVGEERTAALERKADAARVKMAIKEGHLLRLRESKQAALERKTKDAAFKQQTLFERRERIRRQQEYGKNSLAAKLLIRAANQKKITALETAVLSERRSQYKKQIVARHKMNASYTRLSSQTPGPSAYTIPSSLNLDAGRKIGKSSAASYIDVIVNRASKIPAPGQYGEADCKPPVSTVKFSTAFVPSDLDWAIIRAKETPAPDAYQSKISKGLTGSSVSCLLLVVFLLVI